VGSGDFRISVSNVGTQWYPTSTAAEKAPASLEEMDESYVPNADECDKFLVITGTETSNAAATEAQRAFVCNPVCAGQASVQRAHESLVGERGVGAAL
jgi:hypothetical protein